MWFLGLYLLGCVAYGVLISVMSLLDKEVSNSTVIKAMILTPLWPWIMALTINNLRRMKK